MNMYEQDLIVQILRELREIKELLSHPPIRVNGEHHPWHEVLKAVEDRRDSKIEGIEYIEE